MPRHLVCLSFDFDSISLWLAMGQTSPTPISRGEFDVVGAERVLALLARHGIKASWFVPGITIDTYPDICQRITAEGHEIGHHGYDHLTPRTMARAEEADAACVSTFWFETNHGVLVAVTRFQPHSNHRATLREEEDRRFGVLATEGRCLVDDLHARDERR